MASILLLLLLPGVVHKTIDFGKQNRSKIFEKVEKYLFKVRINWN